MKADKKSLIQQVARQVHSGNWSYVLMWRLAEALEKEPPANDAERKLASALESYGNSILTASVVVDGMDQDGWTEITDVVRAALNDHLQSLNQLKASLFALAEKRVCPVCGTEFIPGPRQVYDKPSCSNVARQRKYSAKESITNLR